MIDISFAQIIVWLVLGAAAGMVVGYFVQRRRNKALNLQSMAIGLVGAVLGGILFELLDINIGSELAFTFNDLVASITGALILVAILTLVRR